MFSGFPARNDQPRLMNESTRSNRFKNREAVVMLLRTKDPESVEAAKLVHAEIPALAGKENTKEIAISSAYFSKHSRIKNVSKQDWEDQ
ncbi:hypothetical protein V6N11_000022 [Hibiscus sabdariffa]|uniref:Uncharacterized protein n=1 Tax=Hibiscus sabdariffa TaxID=183260 RepID=A0ABR2AI72_9ROSI